MRVTLWLDTGRPWADLLARAHQAEQAGWEGLRVGGAEAPGAWALVGALAAAVPRIRLELVTEPGGGGHPAVLAKLASTVDQLSAGRLLLGLVAGHDGEARLAEAIQVVKLLAGESRASFEGAFYRLRDAPLDPKPQHQPFPILLVGTTPTLAATAADHWSMTGTPAEVRAQVVALEDACRQAGRDRGEITVSAWSDGSTPQAAYTATGIDEWVVRDDGLLDM